MESSGGGAFRLTDRATDAGSEEMVSEALDVYKRAGLVQTQCHFEGHGAGQRGDGGGRASYFHVAINQKVKVRGRGSVKLNIGQLGSGRSRWP